MKVEDRFSAKFLDGWGETSSFKLSEKINKKDSKVIINIFNKFSNKDKEYFKTMWRNRFLGFMEALLTEEDQVDCLKDGYLKKIDGVK